MLSFIQEREEEKNTLSLTKSQLRCNRELLILLKFNSIVLLPFSV